MSKNWKMIGITLFAILLILGIIIGYQRGKRLAYDEMKETGYKSIIDESESVIKKYNIMPAKAVTFDVELEKFGPVNYTYRISMRGKLSIIDEEGNKVANNERSINNYIFSYNIIDSDIKDEDKLKSMVKFSIEPQLQEEYYSGFPETAEENSESRIEDSHSVIKTNI